MENTRVAVLDRSAAAFDNEAQAAAWLVRLEADTSAETLASWQQWLSEDARHHAAFTRLECGWRAMEDLRNLRPLDGAVNADLLGTFPGARPRSRLRYRWLRRRSSELAVAVAAGALTGLLVLGGWLVLTG